MINVRGAVQSNCVSAERPSEEQTNVPQPENLTSAQPAESVQESAQEEGNLCAAGSNAGGISRGNQEINAVSNANKDEAPVPEDAGSKVLAFLSHCEDEAQVDAEEVAKAAAAKRTAMWQSALPVSLLNPPEEHPLFLCGEVPVITRGTLVALKGRPKVGKSQFYGYLTAALLKDGAPVGRHGLRAACAGLKFLIIDTEMKQTQGVTKVQRGFRTAGVPIPDAPSSDRLTILFVKDFSAKEIREITEAAIADLRPDIVAIDGIVDLFPNFNDEVEANDAKKWLKRLTATEGEPCVMAVIHTNISDKDTSADAKMRGHLGSQLTISADTFVSITKKDRVFTAEIPDGRSPAGFKLSWEIDNERGIYVPAQSTADEARAARIEDNFRDFQKCMVQLEKDGKKLERASIVKLYVKQAKCSSSAAYTRLAECADEEWLLFNKEDETYSTNPSRGKE